MRKKLFAIVMSMTMVASFMPSMAFAANTNDASAGHDYYEYGRDYTIVDGKATAVAPVEQKAIDKCVKVVVAPTCTTKGKVELTCNVALPDGVACDQVKTEEVEANHTPYRVNMSLEAYASQALSQKDFVNEGQAKRWVKTQKDDGVCYVYAYRCKNCGEVGNCSVTAIEPIDVADVADSDEESKLVKHAAGPAAMNTCAAKVPCANTGCSVMINNPTPVKPAEPEDGVTYRKDHVLDTKTTTTKTGCDGITVTKQACKNCDYVKVTTVGEANCVEFKGEIPTSAVRKSGTKYLYNGKVIANLVDGVITPSKGYYYDGDNKVFVKADTTVDDNGTEKYGYTCKYCGYVTVGGRVSGASAECTHAWTKATDDANCDTPAKEYMVCSECGRFKAVTDVNDTTVVDNKNTVWSTVEGSKALGHNYVATKVDGDCHDTAKYTVKCTRKGCATLPFEVTASSFTVKDASLYLIPSTGEVTATNVVGSQELKYIADNTADAHKFTKKTTIKAATCTNNELVGYVCDTCGKVNVHTASIVPGTKLAHDVEKVDTPATCVMTAGSVEKCKNCDYKKVLVEAKPIKGGAHSFDKWVVTKASTVFEEGVKTLTCSVCGAHDATKTVIAKAKYAAPAVKAGKKSATVTVKATADAVSYKISYKKAGGSYKTIAAKAGKKTIKKLAKGKKYTFKAIAVNAEGVEVASTTKTVKVK